MTNLLINYATTDYTSYQALNRLTGLRAGFDACTSYGANDIDPDFAKRNQGILSVSRGAGYWLWKPYFVARALASLEEGDILCYADAAMHFVRPITPMLEAMARENLDLLILGEGFRETYFTKRDAFVLMDVDREGFLATPQRFASCFFLRRSAWSDRFSRQYLEFAQDPRILTDQPNTCGRPNYPGFRAHRHDQSIFSLLSKLHEVQVLEQRWLAEGMPETGEQLINHTRVRVSPANIVRHLIAQGVLEFGDLQACAT